MVHTVTAAYGSVSVTAIHSPVTAIDVDVVIDVHIAIAAGIATAMAPVAVVGDDRSHGNTCRESDERRVWIINVSRRRIINGRRISGHIDNLGIGRGNLHDRVGHDHDLLLHCFFDDHVGDNHDLLLGGPERAGLLCFHAEGLDRVHHVLILIQKRFAELNRPLQIVIHFLERSRNLRDRFDTFVPGLLIDLRHVVCVCDEARRLHDFQRIDGGGQHGGDQRIGIERDGH